MALSIHDTSALRPLLPSGGYGDRLLKDLWDRYYRKRRGWPGALEALPAPWRSTMERMIGPPSLVLDRQVQGADVVKLLLRTGDGQPVEAVLIPRGNRTTLCLSTQSGCALDCLFCSTGRMGLRRNLTSWEILDQVEAALAILETRGRKLTNVVFMGMGEPFLNYPEVREALEALVSPFRYSLPPRRITLSTSGVVPLMEDFAREFPSLSLAVSLHAPHQELRDRLMPRMARWPLADLMPALDRYTAHTGNPVLYEYILIQDVTDRGEELSGLTSLLTGRPARVNLIPYNPPADRGGSGAGEWVPSLPERQRDFRDRLRAAGIFTTLRLSPGEDVAAACGQLASRNLR